MSILVTGSTGKTGHHIVDLLRTRTRSKSVITVSRQPGPQAESSESSEFSPARFDWEDRTTFPLPFDAASASDLDSIATVHLIIPAHIPPAHVCEFIDLAVSRGATRFVLMSGSLDIPGDRSRARYMHIFDTTPVSVLRVYRSVSLGRRGSSVRASRCFALASAD
jgi:festuclavine dehydrogenase